MSYKIATFAFLLSLVSLVLPWMSAEILGFHINGFPGASIMSVALTGMPFKGWIWISSQSLTYASTLASITIWCVFLCIFFGSLALLLKKRKLVLLPATFAILSFSIWCIALQQLSMSFLSAYPGFGSGLMLIAGIMWVWSYF